jgi:hypothetical protein
VPVPFYQEGIVFMRYALSLMFRGFHSYVENTLAFATGGQANEALHRRTGS